MLKDTDIYELADLLGHASGLDSPLSGKKQYLLDGLCRLIGAEAWSWSRANPVGKIESTGGGCPALLAQAPHVRGENHTILFCELSGGAASTLLFLRRASCPPFSEKEKLLAQIVGEEIPWLHEPARDLAARPAPQLSRRQHETLGHLLAGRSYQEASLLMGISRNTVHGYVKGLYRYFGKHSRAALITSVTDTNRSR